jgi:hypothetical protein
MPRVRTFPPPRVRTFPPSLSIQLTSCGGRHGASGSLNTATMSTNLRALMKACLVGVVYNWMRSFQGKVCSWGGIQTKLSHFGAVIFRENYYKSRIHSRCRAHPPYFFCARDFGKLGVLFGFRLVRSFWAFTRRLLHNFSRLKKFVTVQDERNLTGLDRTRGAAFRSCRARVRRPRCRTTHVDDHPDRCSGGVLICVSDPAYQRAAAANARDRIGSAPYRPEGQRWTGRRGTRACMSAIASSLGGCAVGSLPCVGPRRDPFACMAGPGGPLEQRWWELHCGWGVLTAPPAVGLASGIAR